MTDHPILFQPNMIEALRQRGKVQTRRVPNTKNTLIDGRGWMRGEFEQLDWQAAWLDKGPSPAGNEGPYLKVPHLNGDTVHRIYPRVQFGDRLWVKEAHWALGHWQRTGELKKNGHPKWAFVRHPKEPVIFHESGLAKKIFPRDTTFGWYPRNSLFMSRADSRSTLNVTDVRLHRIAEITAGDSIAEGVECETCVAMGTSQCFYYGCFASIDAFRQLITSINGPEMWEENRFVLAYSFGVDHRNIDRA